MNGEHAAETAAVMFRKQLSIGNTTVRQGTDLCVEIGDVVVSLRQTTYEHDEKPLLLLEATCARKPPRPVRDWLVESLKSTTLEAPPDGIYEYLGPLMAELRLACVRTFELLRWRTASNTPHSPYASLGDFFSDDGGATWNRVGFRGSMVGWQTFGLPLNARAQADLQRLVDDYELREPVGHALHREAVDSRSSNPRSAVVLGVAALETAIKGTIALLVPGSEWLVANLPSPPVTKLLREYLPTLPALLTVDGHVHAPPKGARRLVQDAVEERNRVAHQGRMSMSPRELLDFLDAVQDTLYLLDYYCGHEWALALVSSNYKTRLGT